MPSQPAFGHPSTVLAFWRKLTRQALSLKTPTPFYLFSVDPIRAALAELDSIDVGIPTRQWLSCKTQPVAQLLRWWRKQNRSIEVVTEYEYLAALQEGFVPNQILVNGPAKHRWLTRYRQPGLSVNFDSRKELEVLLPIAKRDGWSVGVRCNTSEEFDPDKPKYPTQFGFSFDEAVSALRRLKLAGVRVETVHFHVRSYIESHTVYERAIAEVAEICRMARFAPLYLDIGGGVPARHVLDPKGRAYVAKFDFDSFATSLRKSVRKLPSLRQLWLENGRFLSAASGALVVEVLDIKKRRGVRQLICDGGRTMNAITSDWEMHELLQLSERRGRKVLTTVHGPTCMAFDQLACRNLSENIKAGDRLLWLEAGAYHVSWETRFSHGLAAVLWHEEGKLKVARESECFASWWGQWTTE